jgi:thioredoxin reductase (NADPH)
MQKFLLKLSVLFVSAFSFIAAEEIASSYPVVVLGGGIGGLTSAIYAGRAGVNPLVIEGQKPGGAIVQSHSVQNWPGEIQIPGWELMDKVRAQAESCGSQFLQEEVVSVDFSARPFTITTRDALHHEKLRKIKADSCIIALGSTSKFLGVPGESDYWLRGVYNCAVCDGPLYKDKTVVVVGGGDGAIIEAHYLSKIAKKVILIVRKDNFRTFEEQRKREVISKSNVEVRYNSTVEEMIGDEDKLTHIVVKNGDKYEELSVDGLFLAIGSKPNTDLFAGQLELDKLGYVITKGDVQTSVPGVFAIGDIADPIYRQAISAASDGMKASYQAEKFLASSTAATASAKKLSAQSNVTLASETMAKVIELSNHDSFDREVKSGTPVFVDFYASWCGPCKLIAPHFKSVAKHMEGKVKFIKVNVDQFPQLAKQYNISSMPSLLIFDRNGNLVGKKIGSQDILKVLREAEHERHSSNTDIDRFIQKYKGK